MTHREQVYNWLTIGLQQSPRRFSELFYYDKDDNELFSLMVVDYFLFDEYFNIADGVTSGYTAEVLLQLTDKIRKVEKNGNTVALPRLGVCEVDYLQEADKFLEFNSINIDDVKIWEPADSNSITIPIK